MLRFQKRRLLWTLSKRREPSSSCVTHDATSGPTLNERAIAIAVLAKDRAPSGQQRRTSCPIQFGCRSEPTVHRRARLVLVTRHGAKVKGHHRQTVSSELFSHDFCVQTRKEREGPQLALCPPSPTPQNFLVLPPPPFPAFWHCPFRSDRSSARPRAEVTLLWLWFWP
ncbi:hypothetical protein NL676_019488 [Syzygium grande]|nr:hypothetical protein NL676_019488 [Syzygium grande]